jgi:hypothetical protein
MVLLVAAGIIGWVGATLLIDACLRRQGRPDLTERLRPYQPNTLGDTLRRGGGVAAKIVSVESTEWVPVTGTTARLGMSAPWVRALAEDASIEIQRSGSRAEVNWRRVQAYIQRCRITGRINDTLLSQVDPGHPMPGVALMARVKARFDWSDHDVADALGVYPSVVSRYRLTGVPHHRVRVLRKLERVLPDEVELPRRVRWEHRERKSRKAVFRG